MKLTEEQAKQIIAQVHKDLNIYHSEKYPIIANFHKASKSLGDFDFPNWGGGYDYRDPEAVGDKINYGEYPEYIISIDDEKGEAIAYHYYTGHVEIRLNKETDKYEQVKQMYRP